MNKEEFESYIKKNRKEYIEKINSSGAPEILFKAILDKLIDASKTCKSEIDITVFDLKEFELYEYLKDYSIKESYKYIVEMILYCLSSKLTEYDIEYQFNTNGSDNPYPYITIKYNGGFGGVW